jgi:hypothetical protein
MANAGDSPLDILWQEYGEVFRDFDDHTLARWMAQTLGQVHGRVWRLSHPLLGAYRLAAQLAHDRQIWLKRLATTPAAYSEAPCCRAPLLPLFTRDVVDSGLVCQHCSGTAVPFDEVPADLQTAIRKWAEDYAPVHQVAHWDDRQRKSSGNYDQASENAAQQAEQLLADAARDILPKLLEHYPAVIWEDQDECLDIRPEDIQL